MVIQCSDPRGGLLRPRRGVRPSFSAFAAFITEQPPHKLARSIAIPMSLSRDCHAYFDAVVYGMKSGERPTVSMRPKSSGSKVGDEADANKVAFGSVNANREYFESGVKDLSTAQLQWPGWLKKPLTHEVKGLENYAEMIRLLTETKGAIKVYCSVAAIEAAQSTAAASS
jgi:hypothetical protein